MISKYIKAIPLVLAFVISLNAEAQDKKKVEINEESMAIVIPNDASDDDLHTIVNVLLKEGISAEINKIRRNKDNQLTGIYIKVSRQIDGNSVSTSYSNSGDSPLKPIEINYHSNGGLNINSGGKTHMTKIFSSSKNKAGDFVFISEDGKKKKIKKKVVIKSDGDQDEDETVNVWVTDKGDKVSTKTMVYTVEDDGKKKKVIKISKSGDNHVFISGYDTNNKIIVNGKEMTKEELEKMDKDEINTIEIESETHINTEGSKSKKKIQFKSSNGHAPLYVVDGKEVKSIEFVPSDQIEAVYVLKGDAAYNKYGPKGKNGVIEITTKK